MTAKLRSKSERAETELTRQVREKLIAEGRWASRQPGEFVEVLPQDIEWLSKSEHFLYATQMQQVLVKLQKKLEHLRSEREQVMEELFGT
jgi:hypothetical protein